METSTKYVKNIDDIIKDVFIVGISKSELSEIPLGWDDGFPKDIIKKSIPFIGYTRIKNKNVEPLQVYTKFVEFNVGMDTEMKLLRKALQDIEELSYFVEWV